MVVYRSPVVGYEYLDQDGNALTITKTGLPAVNMIPVEDYNEAVAQYTSKNLDPIPDGLLSSPGDPQSYRSTTEGLDEAVEAPAILTPAGSNTAGRAQWNRALKPPKPVKTTLPMSWISKEASGARCLEASWRAGRRTVFPRDLLVLGPGHADVRLCHRPAGKRL